MSLPIEHTNLAPIKTPVRRRRSRGTGQRTRTGCYTCKARRVKCDETKPACRRCTDFGRTCEGYPDLGNLAAPLYSRSRPGSPSLSQHSQHDHPSSSMTPTRPSSSDSSYSYQDLRQYTMPSMPGYFAPGFWPEVVCRVAASEPAIQHALSALGAAHSVTVENQGTGPSMVSTSGLEDSAHQVALHHYNAAIAQLARIMSARGTRETETILVCCWLFVCIESLLGNFESAIRHAEAGLRVYRDWLGTASPEREPISTLSTSDNPRYCIWRLAAELESCLGDLTNQSSATIDFLFVDDHKIWSFTGKEEEFHSAEHVCGALVSLRQKLRRLLRANSHLNLDAHAFIPDHILQQHRDLGDLYKAFERPYDRFMGSLSPNQVDRSVLLLQVRYLIQTMIHSSIIQPTAETDRFRTCQDTLDTVDMILRSIPLLQSSPITIVRSSSTSPEIVAHMSPSSLLDSPYHNYSIPSTSYSSPQATHIPTFSLSSEIIPALFHTAKTAPTVELRERAIALLHACNGVEGVWNSHTSAKLAEEILKAELRGVPLETFPSIDYSLGHMLGTHPREH